MSVLRTIIQKNRSYRRFDENIKIDRLTIERWLSVIRYTASQRNVQPLKYIIVTDTQVVNEITHKVRWAGYLTDWNGPVDGERPTAYIVQLLDTELASSASFDDGIQLEAFTLMAVEAGYGCCILKAFSPADFTRFFELPKHLHPISIVAIGKPIENVVIEESENTKDIKYYRDEKGIHHVPKRSMEELIVEPHQHSIFSLK